MNGHEDLPDLRKSYMLCGTISMASHFSTLVYNIILGSHKSYTWSHLSRAFLGMEETEQFLRFNYFVFIAAALVWAHSNAIASLEEKKQTLMLKLKLGGVMLLGASLIGPGGVIALLWTWREDLLRCTYTNVEKDEIEANL